MRERSAAQWIAAAAVCATVVCATAACSKPKPTARAVSAGPDTARQGPLVMAGIAPGPGCPPTGFWARCSVLYRLEREGLAPHVDTTAKPDGVLRGQAFVIKIGRMASLDVYLYPDSAARIADEQQLDRAQFVSPDAPLTIRRERTLIENANLVVLLTSLNDQQRERVADALMAGAPQAPSR